MQRRLALIAFLISTNATFAQGLADRIPSSTAEFNNFVSSITSAQLKAFDNAWTQAVLSSGLSKRPIMEPVVPELKKEKILLGLSKIRFESKLKNALARPESILEFEEIKKRLQNGNSTFSSMSDKVIFDHWIVVTALRIERAIDEAKPYDCSWPLCNPPEPMPPPPPNPKK